MTWQGRLVNDRAAAAGPKRVGHLRVLGAEADEQRAGAQHEHQDQGSHHVLASPPAEGAAEPALSFDDAFEQCIDPARAYTATIATRPGLLMEAALPPPPQAQPRADLSAA